jgi:hypothetical protein
VRWRERGGAKTPNAAAMNPVGEYNFPRQQVKKEITAEALSESEKTDSVLFLRDRETHEMAHTTRHQRRN